MVAAAAAVTVVFTVSVGATAISIVAVGVAVALRNLPRVAVGVCRVLAQAFLTGCATQVRDHR